MRYIRFLYKGCSAYGVLEGGVVRKLTAAPFAGGESTDETFSLQDVALLAPTEPEKIIGVGLNYMDHISSQGLPVPEEPYIVHRPLNTLNVQNGIVQARAKDHYVQYEGELVAVIGKSCRNVSPTEAGAYIFGYTIGNDVTEKDFFKKNGHFGIAKAFDTQCPIGPWIETDYDWHHKTIRTTVNGKECQNGSTDSMLFSCEKIVSYLSSFMTLQPGDLIMTGSPAGVGALSPGDVVEVSIEGIGSLKNEIQDIVECVRN